MRAFLIALSVAFPVIAAPLPGYDPTTPLSHWYRGLKIPGTDSPCCDRTDCRETLARWTGERWKRRRQPGIGSASRTGAY